MKKIFTLLVMVALAACWTSCSDDDDNDKDGDTPKGKKLVSKIELAAPTTQTKEFCVNLSYNDDCSLNKIDAKLISENEKYTIVFTFYYNDKNLSIKEIFQELSTETAPEELISQYTLNDNGYITKKENEDEISTYIYDTENYLSKTETKEIGYSAGSSPVYYPINNIHSWNSGNMISTSQTYEENNTTYKYLFTYTNNENKEYIDLPYLLTDLLITGGSLEQAIGLNGKMNKNLLQQIEIDGEKADFNYTLDNEGHITKVTFKGGFDGEVYKEMSLIISYIEQ